MFARKKRETPGLNTTSTADISFMLLIFFLVTSSMDTDWGLPRQLPPPELQAQQEEVIVKRRNALSLQLDADGVLTCNGDVLPIDSLDQRVADFVDNATDNPSLPEKSEREVHLLGRCMVSDRHVIMVDVHPDATYDSYFQLQNAIAKAYAGLRNRLAKRAFGCDLAHCNSEQRDALVMVYPQRISERTMQEEGGEQ